MKDNLLDLIHHTQGLGVIELVKVEGTDEETKVSALAEDKSVIVHGTFNTPLADFIGVFGMPNLSKLKTILSFDDYDETSTINVTRTEDVPTSVHFETKTGDFVNDYRLMARVIVEDKVKSVSFKGATWNVEFEPSVVAIQRLKMQAQANAEEVNFVAKTDGADLKFYFGDHSTHAGNFVFQPAVGGQLKREWAWPVRVVIGILDLTGDKTMRISDEGVAEITVNSGVAVYTYKIPAQSK